MKQWELKSLLKEVLQVETNDLTNCVPNDNGSVSKFCDQSKAAYGLDVERYRVSVLPTRKIGNKYKVMFKFDALEVAGIVKDYPFYISADIDIDSARNILINYYREACADAKSWYDGDPNN